jgi:hypothetical protein
LEEPVFFSPNEINHKFLSSSIHSKMFDLLSGRSSTNVIRSSSERKGPGQAFSPSTPLAPHTPYGSIQIKASGMDAGWFCDINSLPEEQQYIHQPSFREAQ